MQRKFSLLFFLLFGTYPLFAQTDLRDKIDSIAHAVKARVGVSVLLLETGDTLSYHGYDHYPMQSVYKFPISMAILHLVDQGKYQLDQQIVIKPADIMPVAHSPIRDAHPGGAVMSLREISRYNIQESDGTACDVLLRLMGGTGYADKYVRDLGVKGIHIATTEKVQQLNDTVQYRNWATPLGITELFKVFYLNKGGLLSDNSRMVLLDDMINSHPGPNRIKGLLPKGTIVAHKTGTSGTKDGLTRATNDAGVITLPDGRHLVVTVMVSDARGSEEEREGVIAGVARVVYDHWVR